MGRLLGSSTSISTSSIGTAASVESDTKGVAEGISDAIAIEESSPVLRMVARIPEDLVVESVDNII